MAPQPCVLPPPLQLGDRIRIIAPSGCLREVAPSGLREIDALHRSIDIWERRGYRIELAAGWDGREGYLAGTDAARRQQLAAALGDRDCRAIVCARGGYGAMRLLEGWHRPAIATQNPPKWLVGFSDITALLWNAASLGAFGVHGPVMTSFCAEPERSRDRLFTLLEKHALPPLQGKGWGGGTAAGRLLPGNLSVATHLLGTPHLPDFEGAILAFEDLSEAPYRIDRFLTQWRASGALQKVVGIALGRFSHCRVPAGVPSWTVEEVLRDRLQDLNLPIVSDLPFGHAGENAALPVGTAARIDGNAGALSCSFASHFPV